MRKMWRLPLWWADPPPQSSSKTYTPTLNTSQHESQERNPYYCPGLLENLFHNYLGIFPLWSGLLLPSESALETNCHVELWFNLVKNKNLQEEQHLRPASFVQTLHKSLRGRYIKHCLNHQLQLRHPVSSEGKTKQDSSKEQWAPPKKRPHKRKSKFYHAPSEVPRPKSPEVVNLPSSTPGQSELEGWSLCPNACRRYTAHCYNAFNMLFMFKHSSWPPEINSNLFCVSRDHHPEALWILVVAWMLRHRILKEGIQVMPVITKLSCDAWINKICLLLLKIRHHWREKPGELVVAVTHSADEGHL